MIFVTGAARSGTSLVAKLLQAHGCNLGAANRINALYENVGVRQNVLKPYLASIGADPLGQSLPLPTKAECSALPGLCDKVLLYIFGGGTRAYKDAKLSWAFWPFAEAFPEAKWIIVRRDKQRIVESCLRERTSEGFGRFMRASDDPDYWRRWVEAHEARFEEMRAELTCLEVWTDRVVEEPDAFQAVTEFCGLTFDRDATEAAIDKGKWHG